MSCGCEHQDSKLYLRKFLQSKVLEVHAQMEQSSGTLVFWIVYEVEVEGSWWDSLFRRLDCFLPIFHLTACCRWVLLSYIAWNVSREMCPTFLQPALKFHKAKRWYKFRERVMREISWHHTLKLQKLKKSENGSSFNELIERHFHSGNCWSKYFDMHEIHLSSSHSMSLTQWP